MIKTIAFDVGNVLLFTGDFPANLITFLVKELGLSVSEFSAQFCEHLPKLEASRASLLELKCFKAAENATALYQDFAQKTFQINQPLLSFAQALKAHFQVGILSNVDQLLAEIPKNEEIYSLFDPRLIVLSYQANCRKPGKEIYELFLERAKTNPEECLFVDNDETNVKVGLSLGIKSILFKNNQQLKRELAQFLPNRILTEFSIPG
jgi:HAD superfamily hydrolase (TIGR01509 family)